MVGLGSYQRYRFHWRTVNVGQHLTESFPAVLRRLAQNAPDDGLNLAGGMCKDTVPLWKAAEWRHWTLYDSLPTLCQVETGVKGGHLDAWTDIVMGMRGVEHPSQERNRLYVSCGRLNRGLYKMVHLYGPRFMKSVMHIATHLFVRYLPA